MARIVFDYSFAHLRPHLRPTHGPQVWPWWRLVSIALVNLRVKTPSVARRLWVYTRFGGFFFDVVIDRRKFPRD
jgi:hypothetical protein